MRRAARGLAAGLCLALFCAVSAAQSTADKAGEQRDDLNWSEAPAAAPGRDRLVEYSTDRPTRNRFWLDLSSLQPAGASLVRYTTIIETDSGVRNVRHEAIRCDTRERKLLAIGQADASWTPTTNPSWQKIGEGDATNQGHGALFRAMCFGGRTADPAKVRERLEARPRAY